MVYRSQFLVVIAYLLAVEIALVLPARADRLVADLSQHAINISTGFSGTDLLLFGVGDPEGEVIVIVSGPESSSTVRKKNRVSGLWINTESIRFDGVPSFYQVVASRGLSETELDNVLRDNGVGFRYQSLAPAERVAPERAAEFRRALLRRKAAKGLYSAEAGDITFVGGQLFRATVPFPASVPVGDYRVDVYQIHDGWVTSADTIPLHVAKVGLEEAIYQFAHEYPALYGIFAIVVAALAGYGAAMMFGRR
jgi:uncharacterized protein (TIGR02186 family)